MKIVLLVSVVVLSLTACGKAAAPPIAVERPALTQVVGSVAGDGSHVYSGEIRARHEIALAFRVGGKVTQRLVDAGDKVTAGQVLMRLDDADESLQARAADAQWQLAKDEVERYRILRAKNFVSQSALDAKEAALKSLSAQAGLAHHQSGYTTLIADKSGVVMATLAEVGQVVSAGQSVVKLAQDGEREVAVAIPESQFSSLKIGMPAEVTLWNAGNENPTLTGRLRELSPAADAASRSYAARVAVPDGKLALGMTVQVSFTAKNSATGNFIVPLSALFQQGDKVAVWVVAADHSVSLRAVQVTDYRDEGAVISGGIQAGERIVSAGVHKLVAGEKIHALEPGAAQ